MRKIDPNKIGVPDKIRYSNIKDELDEIRDKKDFEPNGKIYRGEEKIKGVTTKETGVALKTKYDNKCGYCESFEYDPRVEHHRPKGKAMPGKVNNRGYYWLCYEWTNMVASCTTCNNTPFKGMQFPLENDLIRNYSPPKKLCRQLDTKKFRYQDYYNSKEKPQILHPEYIDDPRRHFTFNRLGEIDYLSIQGEKSIKVYGLDRNTLNANRRAVYLNFYHQFERVIRRRFRITGKQLSDTDFVEEIGEIFSLLIQTIEDKKNQPYTLFNEIMLDKFEHFFIEPFDPIIHQRLKEVYADVIKDLLD